MLADVFAQIGSKAAPRLLQHAEAAIEYTDPSNEWHLTLSRYIELAQSQLRRNYQKVNWEPNHIFSTKVVYLGTV